MKKNKYLMFMAALTMMTSSCSDFLTVENRSNVVDKQFFSTESGFESLVNNAYVSLRNIYSGSYYNYYCTGTDMYCDGRGQLDDGMHEYTTLTPENSNVKDLYTNCYKGIRAANAVIYYSQFADIDENLKNKRIDEARVIAANYYYLLVNTFGGVPIMNEFVTESELGYPKSSLEACYTHIITELESVITNNNLEPSTAEQGGARVSMEAAKALAAYAYLSAGWDLDKKDYFEKAALYADQVIAGRTLITPFADLWNADGSGDDNHEFIWDVEYDFDSANNKTTGGHSLSAQGCGYLGGQEDNIKYNNSGYLPTLYALHCFERGDKRYEVTFMKALPNIRAGSEYSYWSWYENEEEPLLGIPVVRYYSAWYETEDDIEAWKNLDYENRKDVYVIPMAENSKEPQNMTGEDVNYYDMVTQYTYGGAPVKKFDDRVSIPMSKSANTNYRDIHIYTLSEMFLVAAEAYMKNDDPVNASDRLNEVRKRAGVPAKSSVDIEDILSERACELYGQGTRWIDLRRTNTLVEHNNLYNPQIAGMAVQYIGEKEYRPIPQDAFDANDALNPDVDQNPGY